MKDDVLTDPTPADSEITPMRKRRHFRCMEHPGGPIEVYRDERAVAEAGVVLDPERCDECAPAVRR